MCRFQRAVAASLVLAVLAAGWAWVAPAPASKADKRALVQSNNAFAIEMYANLRKRSGNLFFSPYGISKMLAVAYAGARGDTAAQMARVVHFELPRERLHSAFKAFAGDLDARVKKAGYQFNIADVVWGQGHSGFRKEFLDLTREHYGRGVEEIDFLVDGEGAWKTINDWAEAQTQGKIRGLVGEGGLCKRPRLVLTSVAQFKGDWASGFKRGKTTYEPFFLGYSRSGRSSRTAAKISVPLMRQTGTFSYVEMPGFHVLELPYKARHLSMIVFVPKMQNGLAALEEAFTAQKLHACLTRLRRRKVMVALPRFTVTCEIKLDDVLKAAGMTLPFSGQRANFSGMNGRKDLFISAAVQKGRIDVDEEGVVLPEVERTVFGMRGVKDMTVYPVVRADRPFMFLICDTRVGSILFLGRVANPGGKSPVRQPGQRR